MKKQTAIFLLIVVTVIWGGGFVAVKQTLDLGVTAGMLNTLRGRIFAALVFACFPRAVLNMSSRAFKTGLLAGTFNFLGFLFQAVGAGYTAPSNSSFLTTTNVVMVPFLAWAVLKTPPKKRNLAAVAVCMAGMAVLTGIISSGFVLNIGDVYTVAGAFFFALSIVLLARQPAGGHFAQSAFLMGLTLFAGSLLYAVFIERADFAACDWNSAIWPILYLAVGSNFIAQSLQIIAQKHLSASTASLIMMLEGVFGSVFSILFGYEKFTVNLLVGGSLILCSLFLSEVPVKSKTVNKSQNY